MARKGTVEDLAACYALHESLRLPYTKRSWRILPEMWRTLLLRGAMQLCLVTNRARLVGSRIVSFSAFLFVTDEFCFEAWAHDGLWPEQLLAVRAKQSEAFHLGLSGYHVKEFLADTVGEETTQWMLDAGARLRRDYSNYFGKNHLPKPESPRRPCLVGLSKEEALAHPGANIA